MKAHTASMINAVLLITLPVLGYFVSDSPSLTVLIPVVFGVMLLACYSGVKVENKIIAHIAVLLTVIILVALFMPLKGALARGDTFAIIRVGLMLLSTFVAMVFFIKSFIDARRNRV